ncbi:calmodulin-binding protein 60 A-like [Abrus precatorius]|uniref:Calmodulin-binding protein 60 A-like n=1 Tax=Abrus precatorius TaxID=3816 RepID=A0A8B8MHF8_ABRPR|nr:calmodulin-binding protein 60 A-like [Abrus precatorius]
MSSKMQSHKEHEGDDGRSHRIPIQQFKQRHGDPKIVTFSGFNALRGLGTNHELYLERLFRRVVREEVEHKFQEHLYSSWCRGMGNPASTSRATPLELRFINKLPDTIFTFSNMTAKDKTPIQIALFDVRSQSIVNVGPLSFVKTEICALDGEFGFNGSGDWTEGEFNVNILRAREGRRPLLNGDRFSTLKNGVGCINKIMFTDNSRWTRSGKFRLGAKVVQPISSEANIREARSDPFVVKDYRGESNKKHYPPYLHDEVWRLEKIAKNGPIRERLSLHGIDTVKDLLRLYTTNPSSLSEIAKISKTSWEHIIKHAKTCLIDDVKLYVYRTAEQSMGLLFNCIYVLVGVTFDDQSYRSFDSLTPKEKHLVEILKRQAYKNVDNFKLIDETSLSCLRPLECLGAGQSHGTGLGLQPLNISTGQEGYKGTWPNYAQPYASTSYTDGAHNYQPFVDPLLDTREMQPNSSVEGGFFSSGSHLPVLKDGYSTENDGSHVQFTNCGATGGQENAFYFASCDEFDNMRADFWHSHFFNSTGNIPSNEKPKTLWCKIRSVLKCVILAKRDVAAKKNAELLNFYY